MANTSEMNFFHALSWRSKAVILAAVFALFAPLPLIVSAPVGEGRTWLDVAAWFALGGVIATSWAYCYFAQKFLWVPPVVTIVCSVLFPVVDVWSAGEPVGSTLAVAVISVALVVFGYVGFVVFIGMEGTRTVRMQAEMSIARKIHADLVPKVSFADDQFEIGAVSLASTEMGGDVTDLTVVGPTLFVSIADVSGHGVPAGILMSALKGSLLTSLASGSREPYDGTFLSTVNTTFHRISSPDMFCTLTSVVLRDDGSCMIYNAGHPATLHYRAASNTVDLIDSTAIPLGILPDVSVEPRRLVLEPGDLLALFTDGLSETENAEGDMLGIQPLADQLPLVSERSPDEIIQSLLDCASRFGSTDDDRSVVIVKIKPVR